MKTVLALAAISSLLCCSCGTAIHSADLSSDRESQYNSERGAYSTDVLDIKDNEITGYTSIFDYMRGRVPGVQIGYAEPGTMPSVKIRGATSIYASTEPLYIVDGSETENIEHISPNDIDSIEVLKDASTSLYGVRGANGVIIINTKTAKLAAEQKAEERKAERAAKRETRKK